MSVCVIEGCDKPQDSRGWCGSHYQKWRHHGDPLFEVRWGNQEHCSIENCDGMARSRGWCVKHYKRWRKHGDVNWEPPAVCAAQDCDEPVTRSELCRKHQTRLRRTGTTFGSCDAFECDRPVHAFSAPFCSKEHYERWFTHNDQVAAPRAVGVCAVDGCDGATEVREWCRRHYQRWFKFGDPEYASAC